MSDEGRREGDEDRSGGDEGRREGDEDTRGGDDQFGTRYLVDESKVFDHNAWDNVSWSEEQMKEADRIIDTHRTAPQRDVEENEKDSQCQAWNRFYQIHDEKFFKDRNWLLREFPEILTNTLTLNDDRSSSIRLLEVGCGAGNSVFPLLEASSSIFIFCCDISERAVSLVRRNVNYNETRCQAFVWDIAEEKDNNQIVEGSLDAILCVYVLSAIPSNRLTMAIRNLSRLLRPGGLLFIKDYSMYDMAQLRFKKNNFVQENVYRRGDGTLVHFFTEEELDELLEKTGALKRISCVTDRRLIVNRAKQQRMYRMWIQCKYGKPLSIE